MTPRPDLVALPVDEKLNIIEQLWASGPPRRRTACPSRPGIAMNSSDARRIIDENPHDAPPVG